MSLIHWAILLVALILIVVPGARILKRAGFSPWWVLVGLIPGGAMVAYWVFAFIPWPALKAPETED